MNKQNHMTANRNGIMLLLILALALFLLPAEAGAEEPHTVTVPCGGEGYVGREGNRDLEITLAPAAEIRAGGGKTMSLESLLALPDFRVQGVSLRFTAGEVQGIDLRYALACGKTRSVPQTVAQGRNLWDISIPFSAWLEDPSQPLRLVPVHLWDDHGITVKADSICLQLVFTTSEKLPPFPMDRVREDLLYDASLSMLEEGNPFLARYDETADSLLTAKLPLGVPYYYAGGTEEKFLRRFYPSTTTNYYREDHMYLCGLDCAGMTHLVYEKRGLERHPSISDLLYRGAGSAALKDNDPSVWPAMLQPGDLIAVKHGTFHILMYLGTMRQFGWTEKDAGEATDLLDEPLAIHCGGNPFYYDRYRDYISKMGYRNTLPPDGGVTVSVICPSIKNAPHGGEAAWGKRFGWYMADGQPLLVFPLDDCTDIAWFCPE